MPSNRVNDACLGSITGISNSVSRHRLLSKLAPLIGYKVHHCTIATFAVFTLLRCYTASLLLFGLGASTRRRVIYYFLFQTKYDTKVKLLRHFIIYILFINYYIL